MYNPTTLSLYLTQFCPLRCQYCIFGNEKKEHMPKEYAIRRIREANALGVPHVVFSGGEPTLHPDFLEIFREVKKQGMSVLMVTNGIPIKDDVLKEFIEYENSYFYVSLDCYDEEINDKYRSKNSFRHVVETVSKVRKINPVKYIGFNSILTNETLQLLPKTAEFILNELKGDVLNVERVIRVGNSEKMSDTDIIKDFAEYSRIVVSLQNKFGDRFRSYSCDLHSCLLDSKHSFNILVFPDKNIYLCCNLPDKRLKIGDEKKSLKEILDKNNIGRVAGIINKHFFERADAVRKEKGIFGCIECVEEYKRLRDSGMLDEITKEQKHNKIKHFVKRILRKKSLSKQA